MSRLKMNNNKITMIVLFVLTVTMSIQVTKLKNSDSGIIYGNSNGIEVVNYTSFQCVSCVDMHEELGESIKKYVDSGDVKYIEKQIDIKRFEFDDIIYKYMTDEQVKDFDKLSDIYKTQDKWNSMESKEEVISFLNLGKQENKKHIKDIKAIDKEKMKLELKEVPAIFIDGEQVPSNISKEEFETRIEARKASKK